MVLKIILYSSSPPKTPFGQRNKPQWLRSYGIQYYLTLLIEMSILSMILKLDPSNELCCCQQKAAAKVSSD